MENRDRDKRSKNPSSSDIEQKKSDSENIGRSEDRSEEPSRKSGSSGSRSNLGEQSDISGGSSSEGSE